MIVNILVSLDQTLHDLVELWQSDPDSVDPKDMRILRGIASHPDMQHIRQTMKKRTDAGAVEHYIYLTYFEMKGYSWQQIAAWEKRFGEGLSILGAWDFDTGLQIGTAKDELAVIKGTPKFAQSTKLLKFMPDKVIRNLKGVELSRTAAIQLEDINLIAGQAPRQFT